ncbi:dihydroxyacetone kinase subunit DhaL [Labrys monachus]|uniref:Dihydroxyacetone kinase-like protein n=1 Tax=Labrys monachus TaxID=217067 RepID=A0ABU0FJC7_9HYPH|nr:dihydroxyacetone kinase subunit DhaL [Labrys monachus]MDQ0394719.1 dihydroxyacetone kinase-like protein [Labrys monachus]
MDQQTREHLVRGVSAVVSDHAEELTALDRAIGDGDHGINLKRGFDAVAAELPALAAKPLPEMLKTIGTTLVMKVGGASGPLFGTFFLELAKNLPPEPDRAALVQATAKAAAAVKARGRSEPGQKTLLDVLFPVQAVLEAGGSGDAVKAEAAAAAERTVPLLATRGRASFLGERSVGHMDPGARSSSLIIAAVVDALAAQETRR